MAKSKRPSKPRASDNNQQPDLFEWVESEAARRGRKLEDFAAVAVKSVPVICIALGGWWQNAEDPFLRLWLATGTILCFVLTTITLTTRAFQSSLKWKGMGILIHTGTTVGAALIMLSVFGISLYADRVRAGKIAEDAVRTQTEHEATRKAAQEAERLAQERAAEAKEAIRKAEERAVRIAEEECNRSRTEAIERAQRTQWNARKVMNECAANVNNNILSSATVNESCRSARNQVENAGRQLNAANAKVCSTASPK